MENKKIKKWEPEDFELEMTTHWSFPKRGDWATHDAKWRRELVRRTFQGISYSGIPKKEIWCWINLQAAVLLLLKQNF